MGITKGIKEHKNSIKGKEDEKGKVDKKISEAKRTIRDLEKGNKENLAEIQKIERLINSGASDKTKKIHAEISQIQLLINECTEKKRKVEESFEENENDNEAALENDFDD